MNQVQQILQNLTANTQAMDTWLSDWTTAAPTIVPPIDVTVDPLAVSCALFRLFPTDNERRYTGLTLESNIALVTDADTAHALTIRDYYSKDIMMKQLRKDENATLTSYTVSLAEFLRAETGKFDTSKEGMVYKLPEFYDNDQKFAELRNRHFEVQNVDAWKGMDTRDLGRTRQLRPLTRITKNNRSVKAHEYWFKDVELEIPVMLLVKVDNHLDVLWNHTVKTSETVTVEGKFVAGIRQGLSYIYSDKWKPSVL